MGGTKTLNLVGIVCVCVVLGVHFVSSETSTCGIRCWLESLVIVLPDQELEFNYTVARVQHEVRLNMTSFYCGLSAIGPVSSAVSSPLSELELSMALNNVSAGCSFDWNMTNTHNGKTTEESGKGVVSILDFATKLCLTLTRPMGECSHALIAGVKECNATAQNFTFNLHSGDSGANPEITEMRDTLRGIMGQQLSVCNIITLLVSSNVTAEYAKIHERLQDAAAPRPPPDIPMPGGDVMDLNTSPFLNALEYIANDFVGTDGTLGLNTIFTSMTNGTGVLNMTNVSLAFNVSIPQIGTIFLAIPHIWVWGLDTWTLFDILEPTSVIELQSVAALQMFGVGVDFEMTLVVENSTWLINPYPLEERFRVSFDMSNMNMSSLVNVAVYLSQAENYTNMQCRDIGCILNLFSPNQTAISQMAFNLSVLDAAVTIESAGDEDIDKLVNDFLSFFIDSVVDCAPPIVEGVVAGPVLQIVNGVLNKVLSEAQCEYTPDEKDSMEVANKPSTFLSLMGAIAASAVLLCAGIIIRRKVKRQARDIPESAPYKAPATEEKAPLIPGPSDKAEKTDPAEPSDQLTMCLFFHPKLPAVVRYAVPAIILISMALFVSSNTSGGAEVFLVVLTGTGRIVSFDSLFIFTLANSVRDMWEAGIWPLSLLIAIFSGGWPYLKLLLMLCAWVVPVQILSVRRRELGLMILDALGKWSLIDSYVMILMVVAFHLTIEFPAYDTGNYTPSGSFAIDIVVEPLYGFTLFLLATVISLTLSHVIVALHRYCDGTGVTNVDGDISQPEKQKRRALCATALPNSRTCGKVLFAMLIGVLLVFAVILLGLGILTPSFEFVFGGAVGWLLKEIGQPTSTSYSVFSLAYALPRSTCGVALLSVRAVQLMFVLTSIVAPAALLLSLAVLWFIPMKEPTQKRWYTLCEVLNAWSALEVFVVSIIAAILEIEQFAQFIVEEPCAGVNMILNNRIGEGATCFDVQAKLLMGCWLLFGASVVYIVTAIIVMRLCHAALMEPGKGRTAVN
ncbi:Paraquat-inducible protein A [Pelomyxa schiedti]|nr:Paraquat-inducible protein A [Pelomyxa schiedti]